MELKKIFLLVFAFFLICSTVQATNIITVYDNPTPNLTGSVVSPSPGTNNLKYQTYDTTDNLAYFGATGIAPVVSSNLGVALHDDSKINDGFYGNGSSWIGSTANSWLKIDLGDLFNIEEILFGRDRLGFFDDRDPGQFTIEVATKDDIFLNGNIVDDANEYVSIFDSSALGFGGSIAGNDTISAMFTPVTAQFIKMTFTNNGAAIDEVVIYGSPVPEPATMLLFGLGLLGFAGVSRKKRQK
jgi:hypothetical protein